jgi:tetratricopeptide (TPR) repeat protein
MFIGVQHGIAFACQKDRIAALYYTYVTREEKQAIQVYELWAKSYPQDLVPHSNLGFIYFSLGQYEKSAAESQETLRLEPTVIRYSNLAFIYLGLDRPDDAKNLIEQAQSAGKPGDEDTLLAVQSDTEAYFQKFLDHRGVTINSPLGALAHLQIARAYALFGDTTKAKAAYNDFFTLWKDADPDIPILKEAKAE